jgi:hypothetical protein
MKRTAGGWSYVTDWKGPPNDYATQGSVAVTDAGVWASQDTTVFLLSYGEWDAGLTTSTKVAALLGQGSDLFAVGQSEAIWHYGASGWINERDAGTSDLRAVFAFPDGRVWSAGGSLILARSDAGTWGPETVAGGPGDFTALDGVDDSHLFALSRDGALFQRSGVTWSRIALQNPTACPSDSATALHVTASGQVVIAGGGTVCIIDATMTARALPFRATQGVITMVSDGTWLYFLGGYHTVQRMPAPP